MSRETQLFFIRHGQHASSSVEAPHPSGLTELGREEARTVGQKLTVDPELLLAFSVNNARSLATVAFALHPETDDSDIRQRINELRAEKRLMVRDSLAYAPIADPDFEERLGNAFYQRRNLEFLVEHTDNYRLTTGDAISSYSSISYDIATLVKKHHDNNLLDLERDKQDEVNELYCAREFNHACFRAKLEEGINGIDGRDHYVRWYGENIEWSSEARQDIAPIKIMANNDGKGRVHLNDRYGELEFDIEEIEKIIQNFQTKFLPQ